MRIYLILQTTWRFFLCQGVIFPKVSCELQGFSNFSHKCSVAQSSRFGLGHIKTMFVFLKHFSYDWVCFTWLWVVCIKISCMVNHFKKKTPTRLYLCARSLLCTKLSARLSSHSEINLLTEGKRTQKDGETSCLERRILYQLFTADIHDIDSLISLHFPAECLTSVEIVTIHYISMLSCKFFIFTRFHL